MGQIWMVSEKGWRVISKDPARRSLQNLVPERIPTCLALGLMQIRVGGGIGQDIEQDKRMGWLESCPEE